MKATARREPRTSRATFSVVTFDPLFDFACWESGSSPDEDLEEIDVQKLDKTITNYYTSFFVKY